jgi:hypothetical protein
MMNRLDRHKEPFELVEMALEVSCGVLMTLESLRRHPGGPAADLSEGQPHLQKAIESVRGAIAELRVAHSKTASPLALGFVADSQIDRRRPGP